MITNLFFYYLIRKFSFLNPLYLKAFLNILNYFKYNLILKTLKKSRNKIKIYIFLLLNKNNKLIFSQILF